MTDRHTVDTITSDQLDALYDERDQLRATLLDIDAHATPIGLADHNDPDGNPHHYAVTVGALHRALGRVGHTAPLCTAEGERDELRAAIERAHALHRRNENTGDCEHCSATDYPDYAVRWPCATIRALDEQPGPAAAEATEAAHAEAVRQMAADTAHPHTGLVVQPYRNDRNEPAWVFRCWGTATCDGWLSLDHSSEQSARRAKDRHVAEAHADPAEARRRQQYAAAIDRTLQLAIPSPAVRAEAARRCATAILEQETTMSAAHTGHRCTATVDGPHVVGGGPVRCTRQAGHDDGHVGPTPEGGGLTMWSDHHAGAAPHRADSGEQQ